MKIRRRALPVLVAAALAGGAQTVAADEPATLSGEIQRMHPSATAKGPGAVTGKIAADEIGDDREHRNHHERGSQARHHQHAHRRNVHRLECVDFLVDFHRGEFSRDGGTDSPREQDGHHRQDRRHRP